MEQPVAAMLAVDKTLPARSVRKPVSGADQTTISGPETVDGKLRYKFERAIGTKG
jgi:hypothetical protein